MTKEKLKELFEKLDDKQKKEAEKIFQKKRGQLFKWHNAERVSDCNAQMNMGVA